MAVTPFAFSPTTGLRDSTAYPTNPGSEAAARDQIQKGMDQIRDYMNGQLQTDLAATFPKKTQEPDNAITLLNGWVNNGAGYEAATYYKDDFGRVHVEGMIKGGATANGTLLFTLPVGYRPSELKIVVVATNVGYGQLQFYPSGDVTIMMSAGTWITINTDFRT